MTTKQLYLFLLATSPAILFALGVLIICSQIK